MQIVMTPFTQKIYRPISNCVFRSLYTQTVDPKKTNWYDIFDKLKPGILIVDLNYVNNNLISVHKDYPSTKIVLFGNGVPENLVPSVVCVSRSISKVILKNIQSDDYKVVTVNESADTTLNRNTTKFLPRDICSMISGQNDLTTILPIIAESESLNVRFNLASESQLELPVPYYLGHIDYQNQFVDFVKSSSSFIDLNNSYILDIAAFGGFALTVQPTSLFPAIESFWTIETYLKNHKVRKRISKECQSKVLCSNTGFHETIKIFESLDIPDIVSKLKYEMKDSIQWILES